MAMGKSERERQHRAQLARIDHVQRVVGRGDRMRVDQVGTLLDRARLFEEELRAHAATEEGLAALDRLLRRVEEVGPGRAPDLVEFLEALMGQHPLPLRALRGHGPEVGDDLLAVLDAWRYGRLSLVEQVEGGPARLGRALDRGRPVPA